MRKHKKEITIWDIISLVGFIVLLIYGLYNVQYDFIGSVISIMGAFLCLAFMFFRTNEKGRDNTKWGIIKALLLQNPLILLIFVISTIFNVTNDTYLMIKFAFASFVYLMVMLRSDEDLLTNIMITIFIGALMPVGFMMGIAVLYKIFTEY